MSCQRKKKFLRQRHLIRRVISKLGKPKAGFAIRKKELQTEKQTDDSIYQGGWGWGGG